MAAYTYMLLCSDGSYYCGWTSDIEKRLAAHQSGRGAKYTRSHLPVTLAYTKQHGDKIEAMRAEAALKKLSHEQKRQLAESYARENNKITS